MRTHIMTILLLLVSSSTKAGEHPSTVWAGLAMLVEQSDKASEMIRNDMRFSDEADENWDAITKSLASTNTAVRDEITAILKESGACSPGGLDGDIKTLASKIDKHFSRIYKTQFQFAKKNLSKCGIIPLRIKKTRRGYRRVLSLKTLVRAVRALEVSAPNA